MPKLFLLRIAMVAIACSAGHVLAKSGVDLNHAPPCSEREVAQTNTAEGLRALADACKSSTAVAIKAIGKLNALPLPPGPRIVTRVSGQTSGAVREQVQLEATVYFGIGETYPTAEGFDALSRLVERVNGTEATIQSAEIVGAIDAAESETSLARGLAVGRVEVLHRYLVAAGASKGIFNFSIGTKPVSGLSEPQASDRFARVVLVLLRRPPLDATAGHDKRKPR